MQTNGSDWLWDGNRCQWSAGRKCIFLDGHEWDWNDNWCKGFAKVKCAFANEGNWVWHGSFILVLFFPCVAPPVIELISLPWLVILCVRSLCYGWQPGQRGWGRSSSRSSSPPADLDEFFNTTSFAYSPPNDGVLLSSKESCIRRC